MKAKDMREKSTTDLQELEKSLKKDVFENRFKNFTNRLDDTSLIRKTRRDLARVRTLIGERARAESTGTEAVKTAKSEAK
jgi:large subunit ribosomal protein L29